MAGRSYYSWQQRWAPYLFVAPFVLTFLLFGLYPLVKSVYLALFITSGPKSSVFVGLGNFAFMLSDPSFYRALKNTALFALGSVFLQLPISLGLALFLNSRLVIFRNAFRFIFFSPYLLGPVFTSVLFGVIFAPSDGLLPVTLNAIFGSPIDRAWLQVPGLVMPAVILTALWMYAGFNMVYFLAALQTVDKDLLDAASVDGANAWQRFLHITLPSIKPVAIFVVVLSTIGSFQLYELPYLMLGNSPGPEESGLTVVMYLYIRGFVSGDLGYASAVGWTLALIVLLISLLQMRASGSWRKENA